MCLIAFAIGVDPAVPLFIAANRDEFLDRPTAPLHRWALPNGMEVVGGRDLRDGGTWLGVNACGRVAMLTNVRDAHARPAARSRGELASRWLAGDVSWSALLESLAPADYGGFNLVVGDLASGDWGWASNRSPQAPHDSSSPALHQRRLEPGLYGLSNAALDTGWPKTVRLKQALADALALEVRGESASGRSRVLQALGDGQRLAEEALPLTGVPPAWEQALSSAFVHVPERAYGTRSSLLVRARPSAAAAAGPMGLSVALEEWTHGDDHGGRPTWDEARRETIELHW
jgi:uncharacterized protein with NRDE domain